MSELNESSFIEPNNQQFIHQFSKSSSNLRSSVKIMFENSVNEKDRSFGSLFSQTQIFQTYLEEIKNNIENQEFI
jgi:hypothetical protein